MKRLPLILLISFAFIVSCQKNESSSVNLQLEQDKKQLLFFSDEKNIQNEGAYYDALLEIKKNYPHIVSNMTVISSTENRELGKFKVDTFPAIIVVYNDQVIFKIKGNINKHKIINPLVKVLAEK
jgi:hypothetical protein